MPTRRRPKPTLVLLVRHGHTPTTGKLLPGRARGLHLSDHGRAQAQAVADRLAELTTIAAVYGLKVQVDRGLLEADIGEWTGWELKRAAKMPEWKTVQRRPSGFRF